MISVVRKTRTESQNSGIKTEFAVECKKLVLTKFLIFKKMLLY